MTPTPIPIALRAYTVRNAPATRPGDGSGPPARTGALPRSHGRSEPLWQKRVLIFDTETTTDASQRLTFGSYRVCKWTRAGSPLPQSSM